MIQAYKKYWKKAGDYKTYASRSDYWWVFLVNVIIFAVLNMIHFFMMIPQAAKILNQASTLSQAELQKRILDLSFNPTGSTLIIVILIALVGLIILLPNISLTARRLLDAGLPRWFALLFGVSALYGIVVRFIQIDFLSNYGLLFNLITLVVYVLCLFPSKYGKDEADDSRLYE